MYQHHVDYKHITYTHVGYVGNHVYISRLEVLEKN